MTNNEIESLKADVESLLKIVKMNAETEVSTKKNELINEIESLSVKLDQDFNVDDYKDVSLESLQFKAGVLRDVFKSIKKRSSSDDLAGLVNRGAVDELSAEQLEDVILDLIQLAFGLEPADDEIKRQIRLEREVEGYTLRR